MMSKSEVYYWHVILFFSVFGLWGLAAVRVLKLFSSFPTVESWRQLEGTNLNCR